jgi:hypothetical protein
MSGPSHTFLFHVARSTNLYGIASMRYPRSGGGESEFGENQNGRGSRQKELRATVTSNQFVDANFWTLASLIVRPSKWLQYTPPKRQRIYPAVTGNGIEGVEWIQVI